MLRNAMDRLSKTQQKLNILPFQYKYLFVQYWCSGIRMRQKLFAILLFAVIIDAFLACATTLH